MFGSYIFLCLPPYNSNLQFFEIKPLVPRTLNLRDLTVHVVVFLKPVAKISLFLIAFPVENCLFYQASSLNGAFSFFFLFHRQVMFGTCLISSLPTGVLC